ncbi:type II toxin-antitoxin system RelE/ParE family toxin [Eisenbergiella sp.]
MELILNELSFDGQFQSQDEFKDYILSILIPVLDVVIENRIPLLKKSDIYNCKITCEETIQDILMRANDPSMSLLKSYIVNLGYCEPYWDFPALTDPKVNYVYPASAEEPNCFTEVIERGGKLLSLQHRSYSSDTFMCRRDEKELEISNIIEVKKLLKEILQEDKGKIRYIIERYPYKRFVECVEISGKCFAEEALLENDLNNSDLFHIVEDIAKLTEVLGQGRKTDLWDKHQDDIFELRVNVSASRIFRLFFVQTGGIQFLNGFIKKAQKTPSTEITKAIRIKKQIL